MTTRSTPASSIIGSARSMVNGSGNCGLAPGSQGQSGELAFQKCTWASTIVRLPAGCGRPCCALVLSAAPATSVVPMNLRRVGMMVLLMAPLFGGVSSLEDCNRGTAKRNPVRGALTVATCATIVVRARAAQYASLLRHTRCSGPVRAGPVYGSSTSLMLSLAPWLFTDFMASSPPRLCARPRITGCQVRRPPARGPNLTVYASLHSKTLAAWSQSSGWRLMSTERSSIIGLPK